MQTLIESVAIIGSALAAALLWAWLLGTTTED